ncbi:helix-turn-helix transcriptional regulator [Pseudomonas sp. DSP3-2-2]|uniref:helix-turn-helix transcriptional regulator n=1 Tax=unclassified Pseudomonas TaxID=196821 RepID=UPI003CE7A931
MTQNTLIKLSRVQSKTSLGKTSIYTDPTFPKPIRTGARAVAWIESEVDEWIACRIAKSRGE